MPDKFTHEQLRVAAIAFAKRRGYDNIGHHNLGLGLGVIASETVTTANDIPDVIGWAYGLSYLIECKASKADFNADAKKPQRSNGTGMGNFRYYFTPVGLIAPTSLPSGLGPYRVGWEEGFHQCPPGAKGNRLRGPHSGKEDSPVTAQTNKDAGIPHN